MLEEKKTRLDMRKWNKPENTVHSKVESSVKDNKPKPTTLHLYK